MINLRETGNGVTFSIRVVPRASRSETAGFQGGALKLRITAPPVDGKANEECIRLLAKILSVKKVQISIIAGLASRTKTVALEGIAAEEISRRLRNHLQSCTAGLIEGDDNDQTYQSGRPARVRRSAIS